MKVLKELRLLILAGIILFCSNTSYSQKVDWFTQSQEIKPGIADMYSSLSKLELVSMNKLHPYYYIDGTEERLFFEVQTGYQIPVLTYDNSFENGDLKIAFCAPVSLTTLVDMFESITAPVINTDYRFGAKMKAVYTPKKAKGFLKNYHLTYVPLFHESTHIGDEFSLHGYDQIDDFARINISYEAWQVFVGINQADGTMKKNLSAEFGYQRLMPFKEGVYNTDSLEVKGVQINPSVNRDIWIGRMEYTHPIKIKNTRFIEAVISTELRRETKLAYKDGETEEKVWTTNIYIGCRTPIKNTNRKIGLYYRYYRGIVPYGQLRDEKDFILNGVSVVLN